MGRVSSTLIDASRAITACAVTSCAPGTDHGERDADRWSNASSRRKGYPPATSAATPFVARVWSGRPIRLDDHAPDARLGASCAWERERFTMDEGPFRTVTEVFFRMQQGRLPMARL